MNYLVTYRCVVSGDDLTRLDIENEAISLWQQGFGDMEVHVDG